MKHANTDELPPKPTDRRVAAGLVAIVAVTGALSLLLAATVLIAVALPAVQSFREAQRRAELESNLENLSNAIHMHDAEQRKALGPSDPPRANLMQ